MSTRVTEEKKRNCCTKFTAKDVYQLEPNGYSERILESGFCPKCNSWVVTICKRNFDGHWSYLTAKRKKALKLYNDHKADIIGGLQRNIKYGNRSNMGFRFGENKEFKTGNKKVFRQYAVDFNGTKELIRTLY